LDTNDKHELLGYVLMRLIKGVENENYMLKPGFGLIKSSLISEMGVFGVLIGYLNLCLFILFALLLFFSSSFLI
jgi:hypothetical protein